MLNASGYRKIAREGLSGKWGLAVGTGFVASLLGATTFGGSGISGGSGGSGGSSNGSNSLYDQYYNILPAEVISLLLLIIGIIATVAMLILIIRFIVGGTARLGYCKFNLNIVDKKQASFNQLFSQFDRLGEGFLMYTLMGIYIFLWTLLFIIPGIIKGYSYAMTPYILLEHPELSANDAITRSKEMMNGHKWRLFCLHFSFIGWGILCLFTFGIGYLWLMPYMEASNAAFYRDLSGTVPTDFVEEQNL